MKRAPHQDRPGYVLIVVLIIIVVLSLMAYRFTDSMTSEQVAAIRAHQAAQARYAAISGVHHAAARLADPANAGIDPTASGGLFSSPIVVQSSAAPNSQTQFTTVALAVADQGGYETRFGAVTDESTKINLNAMLALDSSGTRLTDALSQLPPLSGKSDVVAAIVARVKSGALSSLDELLLVDGVTTELLYGTDRNMNGNTDDDGAESSGTTTRLADYVTVYGRELSVSQTTGLFRVNINPPAPEGEATGDGAQLPQLLKDLLAAGIDEELAYLILAYKMYSSSDASRASSAPLADFATFRKMVDDDLQKIVDDPNNISVKNQKINSVLDMRNRRFTLPKPEGAGRNDPAPVYVPSFVDDGSEDYLASLVSLLDQTMTDSKVEMTPRLNLLTARPEVIRAVLFASDRNNANNPNPDPRATPVDYDTELNAILTARDELRGEGGFDYSDPLVASGAWLLTRTSRDQLSLNRYKQIAKYFGSARSTIYRVQSLGYFAEGGPVARVEAVVDVSRAPGQPPAPRIVYFRELTEIDVPRGFEPPRSAPSMMGMTGSQ